MVKTEEKYISVDYFYDNQYGKKTAALNIADGICTQYSSCNLISFPTVLDKVEIINRSIKIINDLYPSNIPGMCEAIFQSIESYFCERLCVDYISSDIKELSKDILPEFNYRYAVMFDEIAELGEPLGFWFPEDKQIRIDFLKFLIEIINK